ncbi:hypothetical protein CHS0354_014575 [Potamilus streckersoni]|uniref:Uncharacterized protein n=1 Tax=Potamilus streckersoni TaxID=2493646 RepID=A0AAE0RNG8_9BIVA|nr:hypothetical protein CHS0354_014575 [Potamilus streckersoni]
MSGHSLRIWRVAVFILISRQRIWTKLAQTFLQQMADKLMSLIGLIVFTVYQASSLIISCTAAISRSQPSFRAWVFLHGLTATTKLRYYRELPLQTLSSEKLPVNFSHSNQLQRIYRQLTQMLQNR